MALVLDGNGTMTVGNGDITGLATGAIESSAIGAGAIRQVVQSSITAWTTTTSASLVSTGLSGAITPSSSSSKVLVSITCAGLYNSSTSNAIGFALYKNGSFLTYLDYDFGYNQTPYGMSSTYAYLDSPATTSSTTYALYWVSINNYIIGINNYAGSGSNDNRTRSSLTLMEVAA